MGEEFSSLEGVKDNLQKLLNQWNLTFAPALLKLAEEIGEEDIPSTSKCNLNGMLCCVYKYAMNVTKALDVETLGTMVRLILLASLA